jgi:hypothetical protein
MNDLATRLRRLLHSDGLAHLVFYDRDTPKIVLDTAMAEDDSGRPITSQAHERAGRQLYYILEELQPDFAELRTGALIRTVLRVPTGAVFYYLVEPGFHLYGATSAMGQLDDLDARMAESVNEIRSIVRYSPLDYGSWLSRQTASSVTSSEDSPPVRPVVEEDGAEELSETAEYVFEEFTAAARMPARTLDALRAALDVNGLHYVACYEDLTAPCITDIFRHPALQHFFRGPTPEQRRDKYGRMGQLLPGIVQRMNVSLRAIMRGELIQVVLDVEEGALYLHALPGRRFLVGVTLDQSRVAEVDGHMARLGRELAKN